MGALDPERKCRQAPEPRKDARCGGERNQAGEPDRCGGVGDGTGGDQAADGGAEQVDRKHDRKDIFRAEHDHAIETGPAEFEQEGGGTDGGIGELVAEADGPLLRRRRTTVVSAGFSLRAGAGEHPGAGGNRHAHGGDGVERVRPAQRLQQEQAAQRTERGTKAVDAIDTPQRRRGRRQRAHDHGKARTHRGRRQTQQDDGDGALQRRPLPEIENRCQGLQVGCAVGDDRRQREGIEGNRAFEDGEGTQRGAGRCAADPGGGQAADPQPKQECRDGGGNAEGAGAELRGQHPRPQHLIAKPGGATEEIQERRSRVHGLRPVPAWKRTACLATGREGRGRCSMGGAARFSGASTASTAVVEAVVRRDGRVLINAVGTRRAPRSHARSPA